MSKTVELFSEDYFFIIVRETFLSHPSMVTAAAIVIRKNYRHKRMKIVQREKIING